MMTGDGTPDLDGLRARRRELQSLDDAVSYVRRVAQARGDLARAELARRAQPATGGADAGPDVELTDVLADRLLGGEARPPRPVEDHSEDPLAVELDELCARHGFSRLDELGGSEIEALVSALDAFERDVSIRRRAVFAELDGLTDELVERLHDEHGVDGADDVSGGGNRTEAPDGVDGAEDRP